LDRKFGIEGALWALKDFVNLQDNPHFYDSLPESEEQCGVDFLKRSPVKVLDPKAKTVFILLDFGERILWDFGDNVRVFGNVWKLGDCVILKGMYTLCSVLYLHLLALAQMYSALLRQLRGTYPTGLSTQGSKVEIFVRKQ